MQIDSGQGRGALPLVDPYVLQWRARSSLEEGKDKQDSNGNEVLATHLDERDSKDRASQ